MPRPAHCSRCKNHDLIILVKNHKKSCQFKLNHGDCKKCKTTEERQKSCKLEKFLRYDQTKMRNRAQAEVGTGRQEQMCRKCSNHEIPQIYSGHKNVCPFKDCKCDRCDLTDKRRACLKDDLKQVRNNESLTESTLEEKMIKLMISKIDQTTLLFLERNVMAGKFKFSTTSEKISLIVLFFRWGVKLSRTTEVPKNL